MAAADAVIHLAFDHETMLAGDFGGAVATDLAVVQALGDELAGTGKTFIGGRRGAHRRRRATRRSRQSPLRRRAGDRRVQRARRADRPVAVPPVTHSPRDKHGFIPMLINIAREHRRVRLRR